MNFSKNFTRREFFEITGKTTLAGLVFSGIPFVSYKSFAMAAENSLFSIPPVPTRPRFRYWWPGSYIEPEIVAKEINAMADAGFGGVEITDVRDGTTVKMDPKVYGWGNKRWVAGVEAAMETALERGMAVDITIGPKWPAGIPGVMPDDDAAAKELVHGSAVLSGGESYSGKLPGYAVKTAASTAGPMGSSLDTGITITPKLLALLAYKQVSENGSNVTLDLDSIIDLTSKVSGINIDWTAPKGGTWHLIAFYVRGTGQIPMTATGAYYGDPPPFVVDVYGMAGTNAIIDYWNNNLITPKGRKLMKKLKGNFFEDSLELEAEKNWSPQLPEKFKQFRGYNITPYLPLLAVGQGGGGFGGGGNSPYTLTGVDTERFNYDYRRTLSQMYIGDHIQAMMTWAKELNWGFRVQCSDEAAAYVTVPEGDNGDDIDGFASLAAGRDLNGAKIVSDEAATFVGGQAHVADWRVMLFMVQRDYAGGVNQVVLHGMSYADSPGAAWPGFTCFGRAIGNDWGPRNPEWELAPDITAFMGRLQKVLQNGRQESDVVVLESLGGGVGFPGGGGSSKKVALRYAGFTYQALSTELLAHPNAFVRNKRLAPDGPNYKAMVINQPDSLEADIARRILSYAEDGLPIVVVGKPPTASPGLFEMNKNDAAVKAAMTKLLTYSNVKQVASLEDAPAALKKSGIVPSLGYSKKSRVLGLKRTTEKTNYYYFLNDTDADNELTLSIEGTGTPYRIDLWSGAIEPITVYTAKNGRIDIPMAFTGNDPEVIAVSSDPGFGGKVPKVHAQKSDVELEVIDGVLSVRSAKSGKYNVSLSNGRSKTVNVETVAAPMELSSWSLEVEDWQEGASATETKKVKHSLKLSKLKPWTDIDELKEVSGVGRYTTTFTLPAGWSKDQGAILELGKIGGTIRVYVNGTRLPPVNQFTAETDVGPYLKAGNNKIEVVVATNLNNRLKAMGISGLGPGRGNQGGMPFSEDSEGRGSTPGGGGMPGGTGGPGDMPMGAEGQMPQGERMGGAPSDMPGGPGDMGGAAPTGMPGGFGDMGGARGGNASEAAASTETDPTMIEPTGTDLGAPRAEGGMNPGATNPGGDRHQQDYGLIGPVKLVPYRTVTV